MREQDLRILAVDDDETFLQLLRTVLAEAGYQDLDTALHAQDAMQKITEAKQPFDCVLLDIAMPGIDGIELCGKVRALPDYRITPILMLTAKLDDASIERAFDAGASDYVTKPIRGLELGARIRTARLLAEQMRRSVGLERSAAQLASRLETLARRSLDEGFTIQGVAACMPDRDLEQMLELLPKTTVATEVFALRIEGIQDIYRNSTAEQFNALLTEVAGNISAKLASSQHFISYVGSGVFGCVVLGNGRRNLEVDVTRLEFWNLKTDVFGNGPQNIRVTMSRTRRPKVEPGKVCVQTLRTAIARATEERLMRRLQLEIDQTKRRDGIIVPRRPRLGGTRRPRPTPPEA
ncbi:PleD family two-component system response regulator [Oceanicola sp. D3]|uniref:response regulator n=1 Tax=Oceanicola sp. D3 TaxID=2587163 RepID=UPI001AEFC6C8|nr:response regulator [Oceanicola sp. D3]